MSINYERAINFLQKLIKQNTVNPPGNENSIIFIISKYAQNHGLNVNIKPLTKERSNIIIELKGRNPKLRPLIFSGHLDTVPVGDRDNWKEDPFSGIKKEGKIYGRGSCDMKSGVAGLIEAMVILKESNKIPEANILFVGTAGEEVDCIGAKKIVEEEAIIQPGAMVIGEPSNNMVYNAHKGALWIEIITFGKTAHGATPFEGANAIDYAMKVIEKIKKINFINNTNHNVLGSPTLNISEIEGGVQTNVVPDKCKIRIDIRTVPGMYNKTIVNKIKTILTELETTNFKSQLNVLHDLPYFYYTGDDQFLKLALNSNKKITGENDKAKGANYYTEGSIYGPALNIPIIIYGPGDEKLAHKPNEYVDVNKYIKAIQFYVEIAKQYSGF